MDMRLDVIKIIIKVFFVGLVPAFIVYKRIKKKISTGFAVGAIITSFIIALVGVASIYEDPENIFLKEINAGNYEEAKRFYKIIIQGGPDKIAEVDETKIIYKEHLARIKKELILEYEEIAKKIYESVFLNEDAECFELVEQNKKLKDLKHASKLLKYSTSIGGENSVLFEKISMKIENGETIISNIEAKCR